MRAREKHYQARNVGGSQHANFVRTDFLATSDAFSQLSLVTVDCLSSSEPLCDVFGGMLNEIPCSRIMVTLFFPSNRSKEG